MVQSDYVHPFGEKAKFEAGFRSTIRDIKNDILIQQADDEGVLQRLDTFSTDFRYIERVHAAYGIISNEMEKLSWQVGLRTEVSDIDTERRETGEKRSYEYVNFFPSAFFTYKLGLTSQLQLSYSRRINRPRFRELNPLSSYYQQS